MKNIPNFAPTFVREIFVPALFITLAGLTVCAAPPERTKPGLDPEADALLHRMGDFLAQSRCFSVDAEIWQDVQLASGQQVQTGRTVELEVKRPNRFHAEVRSAHRNRALFYDGTQITLLNRTEKFYGTIPAPPSLNQALDVAVEQFGITMPLEDLIVSDPYPSVIRKIVSGIDLGPVKVLGVKCEHLAFSLGAIDWQLWIQEGSTPVPKKIVITYKDEIGTPEYTAILSHWNFQTSLPDSRFRFIDTSGASKIDVTAIKSRNLAHPHGAQ
jgi:hypothetical protein